jgi:hypothetical protein
MSKKRITVIFLTAIILSLVLLLIRGRSPFGKSNSSFASEPKKEITRIEFSGDGKKLFFEKSGNTWLMNGKTETRKSGINFIIRILEEIQIKSPVSSELFEKEVLENNIKPVKVKVFEGRRLLKSFLVYKTLSNRFGNIMKRSENSKPFIVSVPGFEGNIGTAFTMNELFWQPYTIFNVLPSEIASVQFENFADTSASFSIFTRNHEYVFSDMKSELSGWDTSMVTRYLSYFVRIPFEAWASDMGAEVKGKVKSQMPLCRITLKTVDGSTTILTLWEKMNNENGTLTKDNDRLFGMIMERDDIFLVRYFDIDPILKKRAYFFPELH